MTGLMIRHGSPNWWTSPDIWVASPPSMGTSPHVGNPTAGQSYDVWVQVHNTSSAAVSSPLLPWLLQVVWAILRPSDQRTLSIAGDLGISALGGDGYFALAMERRYGADSGPSGGEPCWAAFRPTDDRHMIGNVSALDPFLPFKIGPLNGQKAPRSGRSRNPTVAPNRPSDL